MSSPPEPLIFLLIFLVSTISLVILQLPISYLIFRESISNAILFNNQFFDLSSQSNIR